MMKFEEPKAHWYVSSIFCGRIRYVILDDANILRMQTLIEEVRQLLIFSMLEMVFDSLNVFLMKA
jgi:hypothetical protein